MLPAGRAHLEICFSGIYERRGWFTGIESGLGPVDLGSTSARENGFNRAITPRKLCTYACANLTRLFIPSASVNLYWQNVGVRCGNSVLLQRWDDEVVG